MKVFALVCFIIIVFSTSSFGQLKHPIPSKNTTEVDLKYKDPLIKKMIAPATLLGLSAIFKYRLDDYMQYVPGATAFALKLSIGLRLTSFF